MKRTHVKIKIDPGEPVYVIGVVSDLLDIPPWQLRTFEKEGLVQPKRFKGKNRMYSMQDIRKLEYIHYLMEEEGVNISGVKVIMEMQEEF